MLLGFSGESIETSDGPATRESIAPRMQLNETRKLHLTVGSSDPLSCFKNTIYLQTLLEQCISNGDYSGVVETMRDGASPNYRIGSHSTLVLAARNGHAKIVDHLVQNGADMSFVNFRTTNPELDPYTSTIQAYELMMADSLTLSNRWTWGGLITQAVIAGIARAAGAIMIKDAVSEQNKHHPLYQVRCDGPDVIFAVQKAPQNQEAMMLRLLEQGLFSELRIVATPDFALADSVADVVLFAVRNNEPKVVRKLLDIGVDINMDVTGHGTTALREAIRCQNIDMCALLIDRGADVLCIPSFIPSKRGALGSFSNYSTDDSSISPIFAALGPLYGATSSEETKLPKVLALLLLQHGLDVNCRNSEGRTPLAMAVERGSVLETRLLLSAGADVDIEDSKGRIPLHLPVWVSGNATELVGLLASKTRNVSHQDHEGNTPLIELVKNDSNLEAVKLLLTAGASSAINAFSTKQGTALQNSTYYCTTEMMGALLDAGADPNLVKGTAVSPLMGVASVRTRGPELIKFLLDHNANAAHADIHGNTALHIVVETCGEDAVESARLLIQHGAVVDAVRESIGFGSLIRPGWDDTSPVTPLLLAVHWRSADMANFLLGKGADESILSERVRERLGTMLGRGSGGV